MTSYVIRSANWVYNDQSYDFDGVGLIGSIFPTYDEANKERKRLERNYLIENFGSFLRFEVGPDTLENRKERIAKISRFLYEKLNFNPTVLLNISSYQIEMFDEIPADELLDELVEVIGAYQYRVVEYAESNSFEIYTAKINKALICRKEHEALWNDTTGRERTFLSKEEALTHMLISNEFRWSKGYLNRSSYFNKQLDELSNFPEILSDLIIESPFLSYEENKLNIQYEIDSQTLRRLFNLLKEPILILSKRALIDEDFAEKKIKHKVSMVDLIWRKITSRNAEYTSRNEYFLSQKRLDVFKIDLYIWPSYYYSYPYGEIIFEHLSSSFNSKIIDYGNIKIDNKRIKLFAIISKYTIDDEHCVHMHIKTEYDELFNLNWVGIGYGDNINTAFSSGVTNWIKTYGDLWNDRIREVLSS